MAKSISDRKKNLVFSYLDYLRGQSGDGKYHAPNGTIQPLDPSFIYWAFNGITRRQCQELFLEWEKTKNKRLRKSRAGG